MGHQAGSDEAERQRWVGQVVAGFRITAYLGEGAMARVYAGENVANPALTRALKIIRPELAAQPQFRTLMQRESSVLDRLQHENIVRFYQYTVEPRPEGDLLVLVLERLRGETLDHALRNRQRRPVAEVLSILRQAVEGLVAAHQQQVVHRDIKPENLFLAEGAPPKVKILDFGIARAADDHDRSLGRSTQVGMVRGTPAYMAPELVKGQPPTAAVDVYALGLTALEMLLGYHPLDPRRDTSAQAWSFQQVTQPLPPLEQVLPEVPADLRAVLTRACEKDPALRYADAMALRDALRDLNNAGDSAARQSGTATQFETPALRLATTTAPVMQGSPDPVVPTRSPRALLGVAGAGLLAALGVAWALRRPPPPPPPLPTPTPVAGLRWVRVRAVQPPVLMGVAEDAPDSVTGFRPSRPAYSPSEDYDMLAHEVTVGALGAWCAQQVPACSWIQPATLTPAHVDAVRLPAVNVPWQLARDYCHGLGEGAELPTEVQWEFAARGGRLRPFPWGQEVLDRERTHAFLGAQARLALAGASDQDHTPEGIWDLAGNAREWTLDLWRGDGPVDPGAESWVQTDSHTFRALRGLPLRGAFDATAVPTVAHREALCSSGVCPEGADEVRADVGFRCVRAVGVRGDGG